MSFYTRTVAPTVEPITLADAKLHLRVTQDEQDAHIAASIAAAREQFEQDTGRALLSQTWTLTMDTFPGSASPIRLLRSPLIAVTSIVYKDTAGSSTTLASSDYVVSKSEPGRITPAYGETWPSTYDEADAVTVTFTAGYGTTAASVPELCKSAIKLLVGEMYERRETKIAGVAINNIDTYQRIVDLFRVAWYA